MLLLAIDTPNKKKEMNGTTNTNGSSSPSPVRSGSFSDHSYNNVVVRTTEGWLELFLTTPEKYKFGQWKEDIADKSLIHKLSKGTFEKLSKYVPSNLAPNVLALFGLATLAQAWYLTYLYGDYYPTPCTWLAVLALWIFFILNGLGNIHADNIRQRTPLGELFKYSCDSASTVFLSILTVYCLGGKATETQWYAVQISQLVLFLKHLSAFHRNAGLRYNVLSGPGEVIFSAINLLCLRATLGLEWLLNLYETIVTRILYSEHLEHSNQFEKYRRDTSQIAFELVMVTYYTVYLLAVLKTLLLKAPHGWSRFGLLTALLMRVMPALFFQLSIQSETAPLTVADVICDGLFMAVLTSDITLAKMAGRELHPWVVLMSFAAILSHSVVLTVCVTYYIAVFADLAAYLNMPLLTVSRNVYCDGIYDLCHIGHKLLFQNALQFGNRLFVGVVGDADAQTYKRPPIMTHSERCAEVEACKAVTKVIPNAPCWGLTEEFLDEHQIHVVAFGAEYQERFPDPNDDPYYKVPRLLGIAHPLPRTEGLSTTDLIRRIQKSKPADDKKSPT